MIGPLGRQGPAATLRQICPQMTQRRCTAAGRTGSKDCVTTEFKVVGQHIEMAQDLNKCNNIQNRHKDEDMDTLIDNLNNRVLS